MANQTGQVAYTPLVDMTDSRTVVSPKHIKLACPVGPDSCKITCPSCSSSIYTSVERKATTKTHSFAMKLCCMIICCPCLAIIPYFMNSCRATNHYCPNCQTFIGTYDI